MDSTDDDFGELYVVDKVHQGKNGSDTFAGGDAGFVKSSEESECATDSGKDMGFERSVKPDSEGETKKLGAVAEDSSPCDDDDACAVNLSEAIEEESKYSDSDSDSDDDLKIVLQDDDDSKADACAGAVEASKACSFQRRWTGYASACTDPSLEVSQCGYSFSNNWSRTPFDVNLDLLETKPWRNHGMDISDFFNFGLNEQSWKDYCKPLGRAIEVGGGTLERIPSADLRRPRDSDPDVVIQIPVTNDVEETPEKSRSLNISSNEASRSEDSHSNNGKDLNSIDDSPKDEAFEGCQDENTGSFNGEQSPPTENCCSKQVTTPSNKEMIEDEKEESFCSSDKADSSSVEGESSLGDRIRLSPTSSCSVGNNNEESDDYETESLKDSATDDQREVSTPPRQARHAEHEAISIEREERNDTMHSRRERSHEDSSEKHCGRAGYAVHGRIKRRIVKDASSPTPDPSCGRNVRPRHESLYRDSNKNWQNGSRITVERDETEGKGFHYSKREKRHDRLYPSVDHARHREQRFGWRSNKESSLGRGFDRSNSYNCEARLKEYTSHSSLDLNQRNSRSSYQEEDDRYGWHHCERKYGHERSPVRAYENNKESYGYDWLREPYYENCLPITDMDYRYRSEYSSAYAIHNLEQNRENDLHCRRRGGYNYNLHRHRYEDGCHRAESRISFDREMRYFAEVERREFRGYKRHEELSKIEKRHYYIHDWHLDRFVSEENGYKCRSEDAWPSPSLSLRDSWYRNEAQGNFRRDDTRDLRRVEAYDSQNNQFHKAAPRDGWTQSSGRRDNVSVKDRLMYADDWVGPDRGRYNLADDTRCSVTEVTHCEHPSYTDEILLRDIGIPKNNRMAIKQRSVYDKSHIHEIDERHHKSKRLRGGDGHAFIKRQDPVDLAGRQGKRSNQSKRGFSNGQDTIKQQDGQKSGKLIYRSEEKAVRVGDTNDKEEGEIIEGETNLKVVEIDKERIQESLKKMEKRRERFKDTKMAKTLEATFESQTEPRAKTDVVTTNQQRPARKRRWCAAS